MLSLIKPSLTASSASLLYSSNCASIFLKVSASILGMLVTYHLRLVAARSVYRRYHAPCRFDGSLDSRDNHLSKIYEVPNWGRQDIDRLASRLSQNPT